jgi:hypothetical protein
MDGAGPLHAAFDVACGSLKKAERRSCLRRLSVARPRSKCCRSLEGVAANDMLVQDLMATALEEVYKSGNCRMVVVGWSSASDQLKGTTTLGEWLTPTVPVRPMSQFSR